MKKLSIALTAAALFVTPAAPVLAQSYSCKIQPTKKFKQNATVNSTFRFRFNGDAVSVSDGFIRATGKRSVNGKFDRKVGNDLIFSWRVGGVPRKLMPSETSWYRPTVDYRGRIDTKTGRVRVTANFVQRYGGGSSGSNIRGVGKCRRG
ncbi:hypothetical protein [uncultured Litoreibacter sp.]|uniref:hypothetical protein n=1 Tax=uncultured Litoreibacter sp. TaxID=1392394 RepID=UPI00260A416F|nr:hypothetical protein [uncultured Litoreibacter sp.]